MADSCNRHESGWGQRTHLVRVDVEQRHGADPSVGSPTSVFMVAADAADTHLRLMSKDGTTMNNFDTGASVPKTAGLMYDVYLYIPPGGSKGYYRIDLSNGNTFTERVVEVGLRTYQRLTCHFFSTLWLAPPNTTPVTIGIAQFGCLWQTN